MNLKNTTKYKFDLFILSEMKRHIYTIKLEEEGVGVKSISLVSELSSLLNSSELCYLSLLSRCLVNSFKFTSDRRCVCVQVYIVLLMALLLL